MKQSKMFFSCLSTWYLTHDISSSPVISHPITTPKICWQKHIIRAEANFYFLTKTHHPSPSKLLFLDKNTFQAHCDFCQSRVWRNWITKQKTKKKLSSYLIQVTNERMEERKTLSSQLALETQWNICLIWDKYVQ